MVLESLAREFFIHLAKAAEEVDISYWYCSGTCLGLIREGSPIETDVDVDWAFWHKDLNKVFRLIEILDEKGIKKVSSNYYNNIPVTMGFDYRGLMSDFVVVHEMDSKTAWCTAPDNTPDGMKWVDKTHPIKHFKNLTQVSYQGMKLPVPSDTEGYLQLTYGDDWKIPQQDFWAKNGFYFDRGCSVKNLDKTKCICKI